MNSLIKKAEGYDLSKYTEKSRQDFKDALDKAKIVQADPNTTQKIVDKAVLDLNEAIKNLEDLNEDGWSLEDGSWYYYKDNNKVVDKWIWAEIDLDKDGEYEKKNWKYFNKSGKNIEVFYKDSGKIWLSQIGPNTEYSRGWWENEVGMKYYFRQTSGLRVEGWQKIEGLWYYFRESGKEDKN